MRTQHLLTLFTIFAPILAHAQGMELPPKDRDPRLPPVLPGEVIETDNGQKIKVWSSAGPVPINTPPPSQTIEVPGIYLDGSGQRLPPMGGERFDK